MSRDRIYRDRGDVPAPSHSGRRRATRATTDRSRPTRTPSWPNPSMNWPQCTALLTWSIAVRNERRQPPQPIRIPQEPCSWGSGVYVGKEVEFTPVGGRRYSRHALAQGLLLELAKRIPNVPALPDAQYDLFTPLGRFYVEMGEFVEVAGPTCRSAEAVAWAFEMAFEGLKDVTLSGAGQPVVLCHTPSDYANYSSAGRGPAHSTGCHLNLLCPRPFAADELESFAALVSPLNVVFGPGGLTWSHGAPQYSCDPRADHVQRIVGNAAHGSAPKPFVMLRDEPFAQPPNQRLQVTAFGSPRSPVSVWLQAELLTQALAAVVDRQYPRWRAVDPIGTCSRQAGRLNRSAATLAPTKPVGRQSGARGEDGRVACGTDGTAVHRTERYPAHRSGPRFEHRRDRGRPQP